MDHGTPREAAILIGAFLAWRKRDRQIFPVHEIIADSMPPVHRSPVRAVWVVLVEHVVAATPLNESVWIIEPVCRGGEVVRRTVRICVQWLWRHGCGRTEHRLSLNVVTRFAAPLNSTCPSGQAFRHNGRQQIAPERLLATAVFLGYTGRWHTGTAGGSNTHSVGLQGWPPRLRG